MRALALLLTMTVTTTVAHADATYRAPSTYRATTTRTSTRGGVLGLASLAIAKTAERIIPKASDRHPILQKVRRASVTALQGGLLELPLAVVGGPTEWIGSGVNLATTGYQVARDLAPNKMDKFEHHVGSVTLGSRRRGIRDRFLDTRYAPLRARIDQLGGKEKREIELNANALWDATRKLNNRLAFKTSIRTALTQARVVKGQLDRYESAAP